MPTLQIPVDELHSAQRTVYEHPARFKVLCCGRRFGKTALGKRVTVDYLIKRAQPVAYFGPTYKNVAEFWRAMKSTLEQVVKDRSEQEKYMRVITGGSLECWSLDTVETLRGRKYALAIIDEAALVRDPDYFDAIIRPTLADLRGSALFLSTPKGRNHFWKVFNWGMQEFDGDWKAFQYPTTANPHIPADEIEASRRQMPERLFKQEHLAEFLDDGGGVFRNVRACATGLLERPQAGKRYIVGVDLGKQNDFTVFVVIDADSKRVVWYERFNQIDYTLQLNRLRGLYEHCKFEVAIIERNIGEMFIEQAQRAGLPVRAFQTTNSSKQVIIDELALALEQSKITLPNDDLLISELESYEMERLPGGTFRYSAPPGAHDDTVIALALAWQAANNTQPLFLF